MGFLLLLWLACGVVTAIIASNKGKSGVAWFFLGCVLGVFGIILIAVLPSETATTIRVVNEWPEPARDAHAAQPSLPRAPVPAPGGSSHDARKWQVLKEVDSDVATAAARVAALGARYEDELADKFLALNDKSYLQAIEERIVTRVEEERARAAALQGSTAAADAEASQKEMGDYLATLRGNGNVDPRFKEKVRDVEPYVGRWEPARGGIKITFVDQSVALKKGHFYRRFSSEAEVS